MFATPVDDKVGLLSDWTQLYWLLLPLVFVLAGAVAVLDKIKARRREAMRSEGEERRRRRERDSRSHR